MKRYKRIEIEEREEIMKKLVEGKSIREIARELNRQVSSIIREIRRNKKGRKGNKDLKEAEYSASKALKKAQKRQKEGHKKFVLKSYIIREEVERMIMKSRSPELISGRLKKEGIGEISVESIYNRIFNEKRYLIPYLRRYNKDRVYNKRGSYKIKVSKIIKGIIRITERPEEINKRPAFVHWETDLAQGKGKTSLKVFVERKTRYVKIIKIINKTGQESINATMKIFEKGDYPIHSIIYDTGSENVGHTIINKLLSIQSYFCYSYCSWQTGTIANTTGLIRVIIICILSLFYIIYGIGKVYFAIFLLLDFFKKIKKFVITTKLFNKNIMRKFFFLKVERKYKIDSRLRLSDRRGGFPTTTTIRNFYFFIDSRPTTLREFLLKKIIKYI